MNKLVYFHEVVELKDCVGEEGSDREDVSIPESVPYQVRTTMEELAYNTAVWYDPRGEAVMYYVMTVDGIKVRKINHEDYQRSNRVERMPLSGEEPRLLG